MHDESKIYQKKIDLALQPISDYRTKSVLPSPYSANSVEFISENSQFPQNLQTLGPQKNNSWIPGNTYQKRLPLSFFCCLSQRHHGRTFHISWCSISAFFSKSFRTANLWGFGKSPGDCQSDAFNPSQKGHISMAFPVQTNSCLSTFS